MTAYYISGYSDEIFVYYTSSFDNKFIFYCNKVIIEIDNIIKYNKSDEFIDVLDYYYSLYTIWDSKNKIREIDKIFNNSISDIDTYLILKKLNPNSTIELYEIISDSLKRIFEIDNYLAVHIFLSKYKILEYFSYTIWEYIEILYKKNKKHIFVLLLAEIKTHLMKNVTDINKLKEIYYSIDIDSIINNIKNSNFDDDTMSSIIKKISILTDVAYNKDDLLCLKNIINKVKKIDI